MFGKYIFGTDEAFMGYAFDDKKVGNRCNSAMEFIEQINACLQNQKSFFNEYSRSVFISHYSEEATEGEFLKIKNFINEKNSKNTAL